MIHDHKEIFKEFVTESSKYFKKYKNTNLQGVYVVHLDNDIVTITYSAKFSAMIKIMEKDEYLDAMRSIRDIEELEEVVIGVIYFKPDMPLEMEGNVTMVNVFEIDGRGSRIRYVTNEDGDIIDINELAGVTYEGITDAIF